MRNITVKKDELITKLKTNRDEHEALYDEAVEVYRRRVVEEAEKLLADAKRGDNIRHAFVLPVPEQHLEDFDRALEMLEWEIDDYVELTEREFAELVQNEWGWARSFTTNTMSYSISH